MQEKPPVLVSTFDGARAVYSFGLASGGKGLSNPSSPCQGRVSGIQVNFGQAEADGRLALDFVHGIYIAPDSLGFEPFLPPSATHARPHG